LQVKTALDGPFGQRRKMSTEQIISWIVIPTTITIFGNLLFYLLGKKKTALVWSIKTRKLTSGPFRIGKDIKVLYQPNDIEVLSLSRSKIVIFNNSRKAIRDSDITSDLLLTTEGKVLKCTLISRSNDTISVSSDKSTIRVEFDYLKPKEGLVVEIDYQESFLEIQVDNVLLEGKTKKKPLDAYNSFLKRRKFLSFISPFSKVIALRFVISLAFLLCLVAWAVVIYKVILEPEIEGILMALYLPMLSFLCGIVLYKSWNIPSIGSDLESYFEEI